MDKFLSEFNNKIKNLSSFEKINPHKHWNNLLYIFSIITFLIFVISIYLLFQIRNQQIFQNTSVEKPAPVLINENILKKITDSFELKSSKEKQIKDGLILFKNPGIN